VHPASTNKAVTTSSQQYNCFIRSEGNVISKQACPEANCSNPAAGLPFSGLITHSEEIVPTGKSHKKKPGRFFPKVL
jgi:hypothetical protein